MFPLFFTITTIPQNRPKFKTVILTYNMLYKIRGVKMDSLYLEIMNKRKQIEIVNIKKCNEYKSKYGITL